MFASDEGVKDQLSSSKESCSEEVDGLATSINVHTPLEQVSSQHSQVLQRSRIFSIHSESGHSFFYFHITLKFYYHILLTYLLIQ